MNYIIAYVLVALVLAYSIKNQLNIVRLIPTRVDARLRSKIHKKEEKLKLYIKLCPLWPILLIKEAYDEIQDRR